MSEDSRDVSTPPHANRRYAGIVESLITKLFIADSDPRAESKRAFVHWVVVSSTVIVALVFVALIVIMLAAVLRS
ncbi:hypothetical protein ASF88_09705 [Leifsonia sp. Leaf336]|uniref:hypothetical protein n=1 Tax=Leifsonia sp. Leaf336 TaxID=1736341 RepID=UPI0006FC127C|nr:hypothetical protein [Leifsonia sp. Leaf336]KQR51874.1 hypothetical protein ASF88_09705 [Leifsonia sp. Leaf336]